jgi:hypothetical protein
VTCDAVRTLVESAGKRWALVISDDGQQTQFTTWGKTAADKIYASNLSEYVADELCPNQPGTVLESFHDKAEAARNKEELERLATENGRLRNLCRQLESACDERDEMAADLREIGKAIGCGHIEDGLAHCVRDVAAERDALRALAGRLRGALRLIHDIADERLRQGDEGDWHTVEAEARAADLLKETT